jgi:hypothetical protein
MLDTALQLGDRRTSLLSKLSLAQWGLVVINVARIVIDNLIPIFHRIHLLIMG